MTMTQKGHSMKLTSKWLKSKGACSSGLEWFEAQEETNLFKLCQLAIDKKEIASADFVSNLKNPF